MVRTEGDRDASKAQVTVRADWMARQFTWEMVLLKVRVLVQVMG